MIYTTIPTDWLSNIDGCTVRDAITYLQTLDQDHKLSAYLDGDTHGCEIVATLYSERQETPEELEQIRVHRLQKEIARYERSLTYYTERSHTNMAAFCERQLTKLKEKLT